MKITRRNFLEKTAAGAALLAAGRNFAADLQLKTVIIGHTGRGDYGHHLDESFSAFPEIEVVAVADPVEQGRTKAAAKAGAARQYADWREMLEREKPQIVCHAPRWSENRLEVGRAALESGAHFFSEKPFTASLAEADELLALARRKNLRIGVAHQIRLSPTTLKLKEALDAGLIGEIVQIDFWGKQDARAGGEDMLVLGSHLFGLLRFFAGDPEWCAARVLQDGKAIARNNGRSVKEQIGLVAGNEIFAQFAFANGLNATFRSSAKLREELGPWAMRFTGTKGAVHFMVEIDPAIYLRESGGWTKNGREEKWVRWELDPGRNLPASEQGFGPANHRVIKDFLSAIAGHREPVCSGNDATKSIEMIMAVYQSALSGRRAEFPLAQRDHPLAAG